MKPGVKLSTCRVILVLKKFQDLKHFEFQIFRLGMFSLCECMCACMYTVHCVQVCEALGTSLNFINLLGLGIQQSSYIHIEWMQIKISNGKMCMERTRESFRQEVPAALSLRSYAQHLLLPTKLCENTQRIANQGSSPKPWCSVFIDGQPYRYG